MQNEPFEFVQKSMAEGVALPSLTAELLEKSRASEGGLTPEDEDDIKQAASTIFIAGADTTVSTINTFFIAMILNPEVQKKAQAEVDSIIGRNRLPTIEDRESLVYVQAVIREVMRRHPVVPMSPHATSEDDVYEGYFIPKGTYVLGNTWAMNRDESVYTDPDKFQPERFFTPDGKLNSDTVSASFGFGRRICAGRNLAESTTFMAIASFLWAFNITKAKDEYGQESDVSEDYTDGIVCRPLPFECAIIPRSDEVFRVISRASTLV